jgi:hypothetical protein
MNMREHKGGLEVERTFEGGDAGDSGYQVSLGVGKLDTSLSELNTCFNKLLDRAHDLRGGDVAVLLGAQDNVSLACQ